MDCDTFWIREQVKTRMLEKAQASRHAAHGGLTVITEFVILQ
jgi:hypothetical protein